LIPVAGVRAQTIHLFNGRDLSGWESWLGSPGEGQPALGWNRDPKRVFAVVTNDGAPAIRCSGEICGSLVTKAEFENYRLRLEFKWGTKRWPPRERDPRDSGIFYHTFGTNPPAGNCWLAGPQCSLAELDSGDFWPIGVIADADVRRLDLDPVLRIELNDWSRRNGVGNMPWQWHRGGERRTFGGGLMRSQSADRPLGQWNRIEIWCAGNTATHVVNGQTNLVLLNLQRKTNGRHEPLTRGRLQLQSEQAEIFFRNLDLTPQ
jgi:hypothetical protein